MLTPWPPGPEAQKRSTRRSFSWIATSTSSASGSTATVAAEVWMRPDASVCRHALHAVRAALVLQPAPGAAPLDDRRDLLDAAGLRLGEVDHLDPPAALARRSGCTCGTARPRTAKPRRRRCRRGSRAPRCARRWGPWARARGAARPSRRRALGFERRRSPRPRARAAPRPHRRRRSSRVWASCRSTSRQRRNSSTTPSISASALLASRNRRGSARTSADASLAVSSACVAAICSSCSIMPGLVSGVGGGGRENRKPRAPSGSPAARSGLRDGAVAR